MTTITQTVTVNRPVEDAWDLIGHFESTRSSRGVPTGRSNCRPH